MCPHMHRLHYPTGHRSTDGLMGQQCAYPCTVMTQTAKIARSVSPQCMGWVMPGHLRLLIAPHRYDSRSGSVVDLRGSVKTSDAQIRPPESTRHPRSYRSVPSSGCYAFA